MSDTGDRSAASGGGVTIITQTRVRSEAGEAFARWQDETGRVIASVPGFIRQTVMPPSPPLQVDWMILQRFADEASAMAWLTSEERQRRVRDVAPMLVGVDDVHLVHDGGPGLQPAPVSAVISTRIRPGQEAAYRRWEQRIASAQASAPGFQGYRLEQPIPGVQDDWVVILRFNSEANLHRWFASPERRQLIEEAGAFTEEYHTRIARTGFDQWFPVKADAPPPAPWKANMLVLALLYPIVFLFGTWVQTPWLEGRPGLPFYLALFIAKIIGILILSSVVPWISNRLAWWLSPAMPSSRTDLTGAALMVAMYVLCLLVFSWFP
ncbi:MAG TPA: antibiotic biosynthesis monooxygenase [Candidatus Methylomirabilis sp.]|nr:antibiotic biosynthesis monooxygenase [Candidatus Methylomirabilis sp.]